MADPASPQRTSRGMIYDPEARRETPLAGVLKARIRATGPIPLSAYMAACLTDPDHGYYTRRQAIGRAGDFVTAPEISQVFGELIGLWAAIVWSSIGSPARVNLVELGPGRATLMVDALRACRAVPAFLDALDLHLVEVSPVQRAVQNTTLAAAGIHATWHDSVARLPAGPTILLANEFLDALPIDQCVAGTDARRIVQLGGNGDLQFGWDKLIEPTVSMSIRERAPGLGSLVPAGRPLAALVIDYGHADAGAHGDTLQAVRQHAYEHPLTSPGEADLSAQVNFADVAEALSAAGLTVEPLATQAAFLGRLGIVERTSRLIAANPGKANALETALARLIAPTGMGTRFKVLGARSPDVPPLPGL